MRRVNNLSLARTEGRVAFGTFVQINSAETCEIAARSGLDFVIIDMEHGSFGIEGAVNLIRAAEASHATPVVRIDEFRRSTVLKVLDAGAVGVLVPNVESASELQEVVKATRYAPNGTRGACPCVRAADHGLVSWVEHTRWCEDNILVMALVETALGLANFDEIVSVPGLDVVAVGQFDLSVSMGYDGQHDHPDVLQRQATLIDTARAKGVAVLGVVFETDPAKAQQGVERWKRLGAELIAVSGDRFALTSAFSALGDKLGFLR